MVRLTDRPDMTLDVYHGRKITTQQQQQLGAVVVQQVKEKIISTLNEEMYPINLELPFRSSLSVVYYIHMIVHLKLILFKPIHG